MAKAKKRKSKLAMDVDLKQYIINLKKEARKKRDNKFLQRLQKYHCYYTVLSNFETNKIVEIYELLENEHTAYLAPITLWYLGRLDRPLRRQADMRNLIIDIDVAVRDVVNESLLHALRILIDRTAIFAHILYPYFDKGKGFGNVDGNKRGGFIDFIYQELEKQKDGLSQYKEEEVSFFQFVKNEYDDWIHNFFQADNCTKHNGSLRPLYDISKPIIARPNAYELWNKNQNRTAILETSDWEEIMNKTYSFFDKVFEHVTTTI